MNSNNNQISQSENRWQPKASNLGIQNLYQKIQEAARDRNWAKIKEFTEEIEKLEKEEERKVEKYERDLQQFEEIIRRQKLKKLEEELEKTEERRTREELEKEFEEESNQLRKGFKINRERYRKLKELLGIIDEPKTEDQS